MNLLKNKSLFFTYIAFIVLASVFYFLLKMPLTPITLTFGFFLIVLFPGFSLSRILNLDIKTNIDKIIYWVTLGFIVIFALILAAIFLGLSMNALILVGLIAFTLLFLASLALDLVRKELNFACDFPSIKSFLTPNFLLGLVLLALIVFAMIVLDGLGALFKGGDPSFHLAIVKKAFEGVSLSALNLSLVEGSVHITYGYPVWHVFLGALARIFNSDIFVLWRAVVIPVSLLSIFIWYWLARKIMPNKTMAIFTVIAFLIYILNKNTAFLFTCISIPDTLSNLVFFPLSIGLTLNYIFDATSINLKKDWLSLAIIAVLSIFMAIIHLTQFFYLFIVVFMVGLVYYLLFMKDEKAKLVLKRAGLVIMANFVILLPLIIVLALKSNVLETLTGLFKNNPIEVFPALAYRSFEKFNSLAKYAYIFSPLLLLFVRKNRNLTFIIALFLIVPLAYLEPVKLAFMKVLGYIFVNRMYGSLVWHFIIWGFVFGILFLFIDKLMYWLSFGRKYLVIVINILALSGLLLFIWLQNKYQFASAFFGGIYNVKIDAWMNQYYGLIILLLTIIGLLIFYFQKTKPTLEQAFELKEAQTLWVPILSVCFIVLMLTNYKADFFKWYTDSASHKYLLTASTYDSKPTIVAAGGQALVDFINQNLPRKSVILVSGNIIFSLPIVTDQYMAGYPRSSVLDRYLILYSDKYTDDEKMANLKKSKIDYILVNKPVSQNISFFERYPNIFKPVYNNGSILFKVENLK